MSRVTRWYIVCDYCNAEIEEDIKSKDWYLCVNIARVPIMQEVSGKDFCSLRCLESYLRSLNER